MRIDNSAYKILIVDDIPKNIQVVGSILQAENYDIYFANSGKSALWQAQNIQFDLILLDVMMPEMDGFEVCKQLKSVEITKEIPIIFLTAKTDKESTVFGFELGAVDYVTKPFNGTELLARIRTHLELKAAEKELEEKNKQLQLRNIEIEQQKRELETTNLKLKESEANLLEINAMKDKFFSIIAHDLKNPFNTIIGFTDLLVNNYDLLTIEAVRKNHLMIYNTAKHAHDLLDNLLYWSRAQTGRLTFNPEKILLNELVNNAVTLLSPTALKKNIQLISNIQPDTKLWGDTEMLKTVLRNLVSNAIKFTNQGGKVLIYAIQYDTAIEVTVEDDGIGISESDQTKLFRIDGNPSTIGTNKETGTGLGLVLCREFIEKHNGEIWIESQKDKGSKFKFTIPAIPPQNYEPNLLNN